MLAVQSREGAEALLLAGEIGKIQGRTSGFQHSSHAWAHD
jgi:hypothetical protein